MKRVTRIPFDKESFEKMVSKSAQYSTFVDATNLEEPTIETGLPKDVSELKSYATRFGNYIKLEV